MVCLPVSGHADTPWSQEGPCLLEVKLWYQVRPEVPPGVTFFRLQVVKVQWTFQGHREQSRPNGSMGDGASDGLDFPVPGQGRSCPARVGSPPARPPQALLPVRECPCECVRMCVSVRVCEGTGPSAHACERSHVTVHECACVQMHVSVRA